LSLKDQNILCKFKHCSLDLLCQTIQVVKKSMKLKNLISMQIYPAFNGHSCGDHENIFEFKPKSHEIGNKISFASSILLIFVIAEVLFFEY